MVFTTRFAPSPTGPLHLGHAYSALVAAGIADQNDGIFLLRIDDIDQSRARAEWETQIYDDLEWLGLNWPRPCRRQSEHLTDYHAALHRLWDMGLLYPCTCSRRDIAQAASAPQEGAPLLGPDGVIYPGTCRPKAPMTGHMPDAVLRLDMARALKRLSGVRLAFHEDGAGPDGQTGAITLDPDTLIKTVGDVVLARQNMGSSYHLSVVVDDAAQNITYVVRGSDLFSATAIHVVLQHLLEVPTPTYQHHRLIRDENGKRLAKRDNARAIATLRDEGLQPSDIRALIGL